MNTPVNPVALGDIRERRSSTSVSKHSFDEMEKTCSSLHDNKLELRLSSQPACPCLYKATVMSLTRESVTVELHHRQVSSYQDCCQSACEPGECKRDNISRYMMPGCRRLGGAASYQMVNIVLVAVRRQLTKIVNLRRTNARLMPSEISKL